LAPFVLLKKRMIDPISATMASNAGASLLSHLEDGAAAASVKIANLGANAASKIGGAAKAAGASFDDLLTSATAPVETPVDKLLAAHPELKAQLGNGPYSLTQNDDGSLQVASATSGQSVTLAEMSPVGIEAKVLMKLA